MFSTNSSTSRTSKFLKTSRFSLVWTWTIQIIPWILTTTIRASLKIETQLLRTRCSKLSLLIIILTKNSVTKCPRILKICLCRINRYTKINKDSITNSILISNKSRYLKMLTKLNLKSNIRRKHQLTLQRTKGKIQGFKPSNSTRDRMKRKRTRKTLKLTHNSQHRLKWTKCL